MGKCAVPFCLNRDGESKTTGISFHRFPKEVHMSEIWASNIGRSGWFPTHGSRICSLHFTTDSYTGGHRLKKIATPTVFIQNVKRVDKRRKVFVTVPVKVEPTVEDFRENPAALELPTSLNNGINNPSISVGLESIVEPLAVVGLEVINEPTIFTVLEIVKLPSTSICSVSLVSRTTTEKVFIVRGLDPLEIDTPRKATLLNLIRKEERSPKKQLKLRSLKWKSINLKKRVPKLKAINKDFTDIFNISLDTSQMIEGGGAVSSEATDADVEIIILSDDAPSSPLPSTCFSTTALYPSTCFSTTALHPSTCFCITAPHPSTSFSTTAPHSSSSFSLSTHPLTWSSLIHTSCCKTLFPSFSFEDSDMDTII